MRLFIAVNLPKEERDGIHGAARTLRERGLPVRWIDPDEYHFTLKFLGEVRPDRVDQIAAILGRVAAGSSSFSANLTGFGAFPTVRRPRVLWMGIEPTPALRCLKQDVEWALSNVGFGRETRAFHPHLTLGRVEREDGAGAFRGLDDLMAELTYTRSIPVRSVELMRSQTSRRSAAYTVVSSHPLTGR